MFPIFLASYLTGATVLGWLLWVVEEEDFNFVIVLMAALWPLVVVWITISRLWEGK